MVNSIIQKVYFSQADLLHKSKRIKSQADKLLQESKILDILAGYGDVLIEGSYALDVMLRPDLDIFVVSQTHDWNKILDIHQKIMSLKYFREIGFINWMDFEDKNLVSLKGYYFQPKVPIDDQLWKLDIWFITPDQYKGSSLTTHFKELLGEDEDKKYRILEIKNAMREGRKYIKGVDGKLIYQAVLENGIKTIDEFKQFLLTNNNILYRDDKFL
jgi:hypothetical protein